MFRKFAVRDLRPGMYIADTAGSALDSPFMYSTEGLINTDEEIKEIAEQGFMEAVVDLKQSNKEWAALYGGSTKELLASVIDAEAPTSGPPLPQKNPLEPQVELKEELPRAATLYTHALKTTQRILQDFKNTGELDVKAGSIVVKGIVSSVLRNANALQAISKLRSQDDYTFSHCVNVSMLTSMFCRHLGHSDDSVFDAGMGGFFHDLGKAQMPAKLLTAARRLTSEEFATMRGHPRIGYDYLIKVSDLPETVRLAALEHHERIDGTGYPDAKHGEDISMLGKIVSIVDVYDALSSRRVYKDAILPHRVLGLLYGMRAHDLDAELTEQFIRCMSIYPAGSIVKLSTGEIATVTQISHTTPLQPKVLIVRDAHTVPITPYELDLVAAKDISIAACLEHGAFGVYPERVLKIATTP
ncbi:MAG: HD-GYP domain-containing protein [Deltaproteobacteria bacterium]|jgi:HD-GYP domain-containing protein (c-di-GMP phosphodiesterase class II)|nr:HD-GYP domain-containing protein [Deltaproteobacteria bacterium]